MIRDKKLVRRRFFAKLLGTLVVGATPAFSQKLQISVSIQLDSGTAGTIPADELSGVKKDVDNSPSAEAMKAFTPNGRAIPIIYIIVGILSIPVVWNTIREMLRRDHYGGVIIDLRNKNVVIRHDRSIAAEMILVIREDGSVQNFLVSTFSEDVLKKMVVGRLR